jgi:hypothetical protein
MNRPQTYTSRTISFFADFTCDVMRLELNVSFIFYQLKRERNGKASNPIDMGKS